MSVHHSSDKLRPYLVRHWLAVAVRVRTATVLGGYMGLFALVLAVGLGAPLSGTRPELFHKVVQVPAFASSELFGTDVNPCAATPDDGITVYTGIFTPVQAAVDAAPEGGTIKVAGRCAGAQFRGTSTQTVLITKELTLRGGYAPANWLESYPLTQSTTLDALGLGRVISVSTSLTLADLSIQNGQADDSDGGGGVRTIFGKIVASGVRFEANQASWGGGLRAYTITVTNSQFISNTAVSNAGGGALVVDLASVANSQFERNVAQGRGGGLSVNRALLTDTQFVSNTGYGGGGGAMVDDGIVSRCQFIGNSGGGFGGGLAANYALTLYTTDLLSNTAINTGGGVAADAVTVEGGRFVNNAVTAGAGGGLWAYVITLTGTEFIRNHAMYGGGTYDNGAARGSRYGTVLNGGVFEGNTADEGGGIWAHWLMLTGTQFINNSAVYDGGGAFTGNNATLNSGLFIGNHSDRGGGLSADAPLTMTGVQFLSNLAQNGGGGLSFRFGDARIINAVFVGNSIYGDRGSAIELSSTGHVEIVHTTIASSTVASGAAILVANGTASLTNAIIAGQSVGISATSGTTASINGVLWYGNGANGMGSGLVSISNEHTGNPAFEGDGFHLSARSAAIDSGVNASVTSDVDGDTRPMGGAPDLGADEITPVALRGLTVSGPRLGALGEIYSFTVTLGPLTATAPITYVWQATGQVPVDRTTVDLSSTASFTWNAAGTQIITVTATNAGGVASATTTFSVGIPPIGLSLSGPASTTVRSINAFAATVVPITTNVPITYVWVATDQAPTTHVQGSVTDVLSLDWYSPGTKLITVTVINQFGTARSGHVVIVSNPAPTLTSLSPVSATAGGPTFNLSVIGTNFVDSSVVRWDGSFRATTFISPTQLQAIIPAEDIAAAGTPSVTVSTPEPGGGESNAVAFTVGKMSQAITFPPLAAMIIGEAPFPVTATATSGLVVTFTASGSCTVSGNVVSLTAVGTCTVTAHQAGDSQYNPALDVEHTFTIRPAMLYLPVLVR